MVRILNFQSKGSRFDPWSGKRKKEWEKIRWSDSINDSMYMV